jgi:hypothetical protein
MPHRHILILADILSIKFNRNRDRKTETFADQPIKFWRWLDIVVTKTLLMQESRTKLSDHSCTGRGNWLRWSNTSNKIAATCNKIWFLALKWDFVATDCSNFVARITPALTQNERTSKMTWRGSCSRHPTSWRVF